METNKLEDQQIMDTMRRQALIAQAIRRSDGGSEKWVGWIVKKGFEQIKNPRVNREWMWIKVTGVRDGLLVGTLDSRPVHATYLARGDEVVFATDEVIAADVIPAAG